MTRLVEHSERGPARIRREDVPTGGVFVCQCGLSSKKPLCDGSHVVTRDEPNGVLYRYQKTDGSWRRETVTVETAPSPVEADGRALAPSSTNQSEVMKAC